MFTVYPTYSVYSIGRAEDDHQGARHAATVTTGRAETVATFYARHPADALRAARRCQEAMYRADHAQEQARDPK